MEISSTIQERIKASIAVKEQIIHEGTLVPVIEKVVQVITEAF
jgi:hypothetical protein